MIKLNMKIITSPPPSTATATTAATFHLQISPTTTSPYPPHGGNKVSNLRCKAFYKLSNKEVLQLSFVDKQHAVTTKYVESIKSIFNTMDDGKISPSAYDTAWVALIKDVDGQNGGPQFPSCLQWIANHQLPDGSWGEPLMFSAFDRLLNTLACVIALTFWNIYPDKCGKGINFVNENMNKLGDEKEEHMTPGFELVFPSLIELAHKLEIKVPTDSPVLKMIYARQDMKLAKIPKEILHKTPTIMLMSLEGMKDLEWDKLLKLQCTNGSFLGSPSATASAFMQTKDQNCLTYLTNLVAKFNGGVPPVYPVDLFEHIWIVDRLQRLGIAHYFRSEINDFVAYIYRYWDEQGIGFTRNCNVPDLDDTAMAFRILRMNGYQVSPDVFRHFVNDREFVCYPGQSRETVTVMLNLYRASQMIFPGEKILNDAKSFSHTFLTEKQSTNELLDRWIITKDLGGEVKYALDVPWYASLPRLETRYYLEQYGGEDDVWIAKTLYRMGNISNNKYLEMAKLDYNHCQAIHQREWSHIQKWSAHPKIEESLKTRLLWSYYEAAASIFEPERCIERVAWAKTAVICDIITSFYTSPGFSNDDMQAFADEFANPQHHKKDGKPWHVVLEALHDTLKQISSEAHVALGIDIHPHLYRAWTSWLLRLQEQGNHIGGEAELIVQVINISSGRWLAEEPLSHPQYQLLSSITNNLCNQISRKEKSMVCSQFESKMQELVQLVLCDSSHDLDADLKGTFLTVAKTFYYKAYFDPESINCHIGRVLFENVI
uniref:ent-kaurene synthase n=1 Tax=Artemisia annua TaxID=35608 RepID=A0A8B0RIQ0_ARTAN|nr:CPS4 [Artemisia annua]